MGAGWRTRSHTQHVHGWDDWTIVGICDVVAEAAESVVASFGGEVFRNATDMVARTRPDAVVIVVPPFAHGEAEDACLKAGVPFMVEKPIDLDLVRARSVASAQGGDGVYLLAWGEWKRLVDSQGEVRRAGGRADHALRGFTQPLLWSGAVCLRGGAPEPFADHRRSEYRGWECRDHRLSEWHARHGCVRVFCDRARRCSGWSRHHLSGREHPVLSGNPQGRDPGPNGGLPLSE